MHNPSGSKFLHFYQIRKTAQRARSRQAPIAELLTSSHYKNVLIEKVALRGRDGELGCQEEQEGKQKGEEKQGRLMAVGGTRPGYM